jgi:hypothetical protein
MVASYDWESDTYTHHDPTRQLWRETVAEIADKATATLPECASRIERAVALVLAGDVTLQADGTARVASQQRGRTQYLVVNGTCECKDYTDAKAPRQLCKHRLAAAIAHRAADLVRATVHQGEGDTGTRGRGDTARDSGSGPRASRLREPLTRHPPQRPLTEPPHRSPEGTARLASRRSMSC